MNCCYKLKGEEHKHTFKGIITFKHFLKFFLCVSECHQVHASIVSLLLVELHSEDTSSLVLLKPLTNLCTLHTQSV